MHATKKRLRGLKVFLRTKLVCPLGLRWPPSPSPCPCPCAMRGLLRGDGDGEDGREGDDGREKEGELKGDRKGEFSDDGDESAE